MWPTKFVIACLLLCQCAQAMFEEDPKPTVFVSAEDKRREEKAVALLEQAEALADEGNLQGAVSKYKQAIQLAPRLPHPHFNIAVTYDAMGKPDKAKTHYLRCLELAEDLAHIFDCSMNLALLYKESGNLTGAMQHMQRAADIHLRDAPVLFQAGELALQVGDTAKALERFRDAASYEHRVPLFLASYVNLLAKLGHEQQAVAALKVTRNFTAPFYQLELAKLIEDTLPEEALACLENGVRNSKGLRQKASLTYALGHLLHKLGFEDNETALYEQAVADGVWTNPQQRPAYLFIAHPLVAEPWPTPSPELAAALEALAASHAAIQEEVRNVVLAEEGSAKLKSDAERLVGAGTWRLLTFMRDGHVDNATLAAHPVIAAALQPFIETFSHELPRGSIELSVLSGKSHLRPHCGPSNHRLRAHLGVIVPEGSRIRVGNETRSWVEGGTLLFDDSFEHEVWNDADELRAVLIVDVWHPDLSEDERTAVRLDWFWKRDGSPTKGH